MALYSSVNPLLHMKCVRLKGNLSASWWQRIILLLFGVCLLLDSVAGNTAAPSGLALFCVIHCYGHLIPSGLLPASHETQNKQTKKQPPKVKRQASSLFSSKPSTCKVPPSQTMQTSAPYRTTKASRGQGNRSTRIEVKLQHFGLCISSTFQTEYLPFSSSGRKKVFFLIMNERYLLGLTHRV